MTYRKLGTRDLITAETSVLAARGTSGPEKAHDTRAGALLAEIG